ncbi:alpha/beta hydrolase [Rhodococcus erythropolis]|uniref:alpha/beta hydrolase n=1 Tax=Rhodococcus erythropolis TaxID=1833 RepID=UPI002949BAD6|nr:alpha/beta hydrolase [Rhodococcus erythropolis]MDV6274413.1 alpha/beta hydrolase [Rhodococcus erythropolis]
MRPTISQLRAWSPEQLRTCASELVDIDRKIELLGGDAGRSTDAVREFWRGEASSAAAVQWSGISLTASHLSIGIRAVADLYAGAANTIGVARRSVLDLVEEATLEHGLTVTDSGAVSAPASTQPWNIADVMRDFENATAAQNFQQKISTALTALDDEDNRAATALRQAFREIGSLLGHQPDRLSRTVVDILDGRSTLPGTPIELHRLWESLTPSEKDALARWDPSIGSRDGLPALDRDYYNRRYLAALETALESSPDRTVAAGYAAVRGELRPDTFLLSVTGGHAVVAVGNPDAADNVATLIPGTGSGLSGVGGDLQRTRAMYDAAVSAAPTEATSVILWSGYDAPPGIPDAGSDRYADAAAPGLDTFQDGLRTSHDGPPSHNVVIGHSYGSTVIGAATTRGASLDVDELVFVASPGVDAERVYELSLDGVDSAEMARHVHSTTAFWDPVQLIPKILGVHGFDPSDSEFGAQVLAGSPGEPGFGVHSDYWESGNPALTELGRIITGP